MKRRNTQHKSQRDNENNSDDDNTPVTTEFDGVNVYLSSIGRHKLLSADDEIALARAIAIGDKSARNRMIESNLRLVVKIAVKYVRDGLSLLDLIQDGNIGLMRAVDKYDPDKGFRFSTYATWWIMCHITRGINDKYTLVRSPVSVTHEMRSYLRAERELTQRLGRRATDSELAELVGKCDEYVRDMRALVNSKQSVDYVYISDDDDKATNVVDMLASSPESDTQNVAEHEIMIDLVSECLSQLTDKQQEVIARRFGLRGHKADVLDKIGEEIGLSRERVRQLQVIALDKLRALLGVRSEQG